KKLNMYWQSSVLFSAIYCTNLLQNTAGQKVQDPIEDDHALRWIDPVKAIEDLFHEHQRWAVQKVLEENL
ncbi:hypothetical protein ACRPK8_15485, partial [Exiguobacterium sp. TDN 0502]